MLAKLIAGRRLLLLCVVLGMTALSGCNRGPAVAQVKGKVLYKDGTVPKGGVRVVRFEPTDDMGAEFRHAANGAIQTDGSFEMCRKKPGDGVYYGDYHVTFTIMKAPREPVSLVAPKYTHASTTPYQITVDGDRDDLFFEIEPIK